MTNFTLTVAAEGDAVILRPAGYLDNLGAEQLMEASGNALRAGCRRIVLDCGGVRFINSVGISILVSLIQRTREADCSLSFTRVSQVHQEVFSIVGISKLVSVLGSERDAWSPLGAGR